MVVEIYSMKGRLVIDVKIYLSVYFPYGSKYESLANPPNQHTSFDTQRSGH